MKNTTSARLSRHHGTMLSMTAPKTTPDSPRNQWPARMFRLDEESMAAVRVKLAPTGEKWQGLVEVLVRGWLAGLIDADKIREQLKEK